MRFRPCIDLHNGAVKQIVGASLRAKAEDETQDSVKENFVASYDALHYAGIFHEEGLSGGHIILLNRAGTPEYDASLAQALAVLHAFPDEWQIGGGITPETAASFLDAGAAGVIVTSYVFREGMVDESRLHEMEQSVGKEHLILDISCKKRNEGESSSYFIVTDRWTKMTQTPLNAETIRRLSAHCAEFLVHAADVEGLQSGIEEEIVTLLGAQEEIVSTYAGGIGSAEDIARIRSLGNQNVDFTVGSALDLYGGTLSLQKILEASG